jgi:hypothetical protein
MTRSAVKQLTRDEARRIAVKYREVAGTTNAPLMRLATTSIASRTNPCSRSVGRDSPEHSKAFYSNMSNMAHSEVERSSHSSRKGSGFSCRVDTLR